MLKRRYDTSLGLLLVAMAVLLVPTNLTGKGFEGTSAGDSLYLTELDGPLCTEFNVGGHDQSLADVAMGDLSGSGTELENCGNGVCEGQLGENCDTCRTDCANKSCLSEGVECNYLNNCGQLEFCGNCSSGFACSEGRCVACEPIHCFDESMCPGGCWCSGDTCVEVGGFEYCYNNFECRN